MAESAESNVDRRETEKFNAFAAEWWDPHGPMHSLHAVNPLRLKFIRDAVDVRGKVLLDVGCGGGLLAESLARAGAQVTGVDLSADLLEMARRHAQMQGLPVDYRVQSAEQVAEERPESFDIVICMEVLEHIPEPGKAVAACARALKPGGHAFFSTIDRTPKSFLFAIVGAEYILRLLPIGSHRYGGLIRPAELKTWAAQSGLEFRDSASQTYNLLRRRFRLAPHHDVNYLMHFVKR